MKPFKCEQRLIPGYINKRGFAATKCPKTVHAENAEQADQLYAKFLGFNAFTHVYERSVREITS